MERIIFSIILLIAIQSINAQIKSEVNECFELTSIVFRLAEANEYVNNGLKVYTNDIDRYFLKHKEHQLIAFAKEIRMKHRIGYDAVSTAASLLEIHNGRVVVNPVFDISKISEKDSRWTKESFETFVNLLDDFYNKTKFRRFYNQHADLYQLAVTRMDQLLLSFNIHWFKTLFGDNIQEPFVIVSLCNGNKNYAIISSEKTKKNGMAIGCGFDNDGLPAFNHETLLVIVHEFLHSYTNPLIDNYWSQMNTSAQVIYSHVKEDLRKRAYEGAKVAMCEWFTNVFAIMYVLENTEKSFDKRYLLNRYHNYGFIWMERSLAFMEYFRNYRHLFPTVEDYMPQIVEFINYTANNIEHVLKEYTNRAPYIVEIFPAQGSTINFDVDTIKMRFSEPMHGAHGTMLVDDEKINPIPFSAMPSWENEDKLVYIIPLDKNKLEIGKTYGIKLNSQYFQSGKTYPMKEDFIYTFKVAEK